jgi:predicted dinucleotide-binding enzyme
MWAKPFGKASSEPAMKYELPAEARCPRPQQLSLFAAGDDAAARKAVLELGKAIGFDAIDAGPLKNARHLEPLGYFNIQLGYVLGHGPNIGFKLAH